MEKDFKHERQEKKKALHFFPRRALYCHDHLENLPGRNSPNLYFIFFIHTQIWRIFEDDYVICSSGALTQPTDVEAWSYHSSFREISICVYELSKCIIFLMLINFMNQDFREYSMFNLHSALKQKKLFDHGKIYCQIFNINIIL